MVFPSDRFADPIRGQREIAIMDCRLEEDAHSDQFNEEMEASIDSARNAKILINPKKKGDYLASPGVLGVTPAR